MSGPRLLVVRVGAMGDVLHALPAVARLRASLPDAHIGWAIEPRWQALLRAPAATGRDPNTQPLVDALHLVPTREWSLSPLSLATAKSVLALRRELRAGHYGIALDLQGSIRSAAIARASGAHVIGSASPREVQARWFYAQTVSTTERHVVRQAQQIADEALALLRAKPSGGSNGASLLPHDTAAAAWAETVVQADARRSVLLAPTAGWAAKQWPAQRYGELAARLAARGYRVLVNAAGAHDDVAQEVCAAAASFGPHEVPQTVSSSLPQLIKLVRRVALVVAGDSGPLHLADAVGTPVVGLFGPTDPLRNGPLGPGARNLRDAASRTSYKHVAQPDAGLARLSVQSVLEAALAALANPASTAAPE